MAESPYSGGEYPLTDFDKLATKLAWFGALVMITLRVLLVKPAKTTYGPLDQYLPGLTKIVFSPAFTASGVILMLFLAWYGRKMRKMYDSRSASNIMFFSIVVAVLANGLLVYGLYSPAGGALDHLYDAH
ncbi:MAG: hypothetical protein CMN30_02700 [Sandaracinus sp.]|nr:hypothetical protein [Sandaracinus sp.]|tara:strand:+ start:2853 stop:3242 length:390 start_codon:yes stop_codon:yes gene_type:complete